MRIAIATDTFTPQVNGVTTVLQRIVRVLRSVGHEVAVVAPRYPNGSAGGGELRLRSMPCPTYPAIRLTMPRYRRLACFLDRHEPDVLHVPTEGPLGLLGRSYALRRGLPLITAFHTNFQQYAENYGMPWLSPSVWRWLVWFHRPARLTYAPGTAVRDELHRRGIRQAAVWGCGVDTHAFQPARRNSAWRHGLGIADDTAVVLHVGRLAPEKNLDVLADAWCRVRERVRTRVAFVLAGEGPASRALIRRMPWAHSFGFLERDALAEVYASSEICTLPSRTETCGLVALEAMASGVPVVAADAGGFRDTIVSGESGLLVPAVNAAAFADAITALIERPDRRAAMGRAARHAAEARDVEAGNAELLEQFAEAAGQPLRGSACTAA